MGKQMQSFPRVGLPYRRRFQEAAVGFALVSLCLVSAPAGASPTPQQKCQLGKNKVAGKYASCLQNAEARLISNGDMVKYGEAITKCQTKFSSKWQSLINTAAGDSATCPDAPLTVAQFQAVIDEHSDNITT